MQFTITWDTVKDIGLFIIAVWGAALSTFNWLQGRKRDRRTVVVTTFNQYEIFGNGDIGARYLEVRAANSGHRPVSIQSLTFETPDNKWVQGSVNIPGMQSSQLPVELSDGNTASAYFRVQGIRSGLFRPGISRHIHLTPIAVDTLGKSYRGKPVEIDISVAD